jgi:CMP-N-acetylneuraminic acid synthetase
MVLSASCLTVIPARGGSKGIKRKNLQLLCGKPLVVWSVEQALAANVSSDVLVSTDDREIAEIAHRAGAWVPDLRPARLASDDSPIIETVKHSLAFLREKRGRTYTTVLLLEPTSPLRKPGDVEQVLALVTNPLNSMDSAVTVGRYLEHPRLAFTPTQGGYLRPYIPRQPKTESLRRQDLPECFFPYGVAYCSTVESLQRNDSFFSDSMGYFELQPWQCFEVDEPIDLALHQFLMQKYLLV